MRPLFRRAPIGLANLEGPIAREAEKLERNYTYRVSPRTTKTMLKAGINVVRLANNHLLDCGRDGRRAVSEIWFHCLRHTAVSLLKSAGVSDAVARDLVGHESGEVSRLYTHIEDKAKRKAVNRLPVIG